MGSSDHVNKTLGPALSPLLTPRSKRPPTEKQVGVNSLEQLPGGGYRHLQMACSRGGPGNRGWTIILGPQKKKNGVLCSGVKN